MEKMMANRPWPCYFPDSSKFEGQVNESDLKKKDKGIKNSQKEPTG